MFFRILSITTIGAAIGLVSFGLSTSLMARPLLPAEGSGTVSTSRQSSTTVSGGEKSATATRSSTRSATRGTTQSEGSGATATTSSSTSVSSGSTTTATTTSDTSTQWANSAWDTTYGRLTVSNPQNTHCGVYKYDVGRLTNCHITGNTLSGIWVESGVQTGQFSFTLGSGGKTFTGWWNYSGSSSRSQWTGKRVK